MPNYSFTYFDRLILALFSFSFFFQKKKLGREGGRGKKHALDLICILY
jgi:hypothetical protein